MNTRFLVVVAMLATVLSLSANAQTTEKPKAATMSLGENIEGVPVTLPQAKQYDFVSGINGKTYRLFVSEPAEAASGKAFPIIYVLDGNPLFATASAVSWWFQLNAIVVGIGYPNDSVSQWYTRRRFELTPIADPTEKNPSGGGDALVQVILEEVRPFVESRLKIEKGRQAIFGYSLGGLMVLRILFQHPTAFDTYIAGSPSIWFKYREVLQDEEAFSKRAKAGELHLRLLITSAGLEQYRGEDSAKLADANQHRMIDNASELADRLSGLDPQNVRVTRQILPDETHNSGAMASLVRGVIFATQAPTSR